LALFFFFFIATIDVADFAVAPASISIGEDIVFSFTLLTKKATKARLEYAVDYVKATGKRSRKIFQISEISLKENQTKLYTKKHSFADSTIRKHHPGPHSITLIVNGAEHTTLDFELNV
jgi:hypothetical protein